MLLSCPCLCVFFYKEIFFFLRHKDVVCCYDDKRYLAADYVNTFPYGRYDYDPAKLADKDWCANNLPDAKHVLKPGCVPVKNDEQRKVNLQRRENIESSLVISDALIDAFGRKLKLENFQFIKNKFRWDLAKQLSDDISPLPLLENIALDMKERIAYESMVSHRKRRIQNEESCLAKRAHISPI